MDCRTCVNWYDDFIDMNPGRTERAGLFYGCRILGPIENFQCMEDCPHFQQSEESFVLCGTCGLSVPKICLLLGECVNCTDTDLFCQDSCSGGEWRKFCTHWNRLSLEGRNVVEQDQLQVVFPAVAPPPPSKNRPRLRDMYDRHVTRHRECRHSHRDRR